MYRTEVLYEKKEIQKHAKPSIFGGMLLNMTNKLALEHVDGLKPYHCQRLDAAGNRVCGTCTLLSLEGHANREPGRALS